MADPKDPSENGLTWWQIRAKRMVEPMLQVPDNRRLIEEISEVFPEHEWDDKIDHIIMLVLELPRNCRSLIKNYMLTGELDYSLVEQAQLRIRSDKDQTLLPGENPHEEYEKWVHDKNIMDLPEVSLILDPTITKEELLKYIENRFNKDIEPKLSLLRGGPRKRVRGRPKSLRDGVVLTESDKGKSNSRIAREFDANQGIDTPEDVIQIKKRHKQDKAI